jgi:outer membrane protein OmpA-like peptidoglycan-associated protein
MRSLISVLILLFTFSVSYAQNLHTTSKTAEKSFQEALRNFNLQQNDEALKQLEKCIRADPEFIEAYMLKAQIHNNKHEFEDAISCFKKGLSIDPKFNPSGYIVLADAEMNQGLYADAITHAEKFIELGDFRKISRAEADSFISNCNFALKCFNNPVPFNPVNLGDSVNSVYNEYWPSLSLDESELIFTVLDPADPVKTAQHTSFQEDFYESFHKPDGSWSHRINAGSPLNTNDNEGSQSVSADGKYLFFTGCNREDGAGKCDIYFSINNHGIWSVPENLGFPVNSGYSEKHPSISADGYSLYFASDRPGGSGGLDIWVSHLNKDKTWSFPINLGDKINTNGDEQSPFIHPDNQTLYFSSEGHGNMGKGDIFLSRLDSSGKWQAPVNLGYPINTWNNELGLIVNASGDKAFYASDRMKERGLDIYEFDLYGEVQPVPVSYMKGRVYDSRNYKGIQAVFQLIDLQTGKLFTEASSESGSGEYLVSLPSGHDYALNISRKGYLFYSDNFSLKDIHKRSDPFLKDVPLSPVSAGEKVILKNIFYEFNSFGLKPESQSELNKIIEFLSMNPSICIEISGHTDSIGNSAYNQQLSEKRAKSVVDYLSAKGIQINRLSYKGYGASVPLESNDTESGRAGNRRTELRIIN